MSKFKGDKVRIIAETMGHEFEIGSIVTIDIVDGDGSYEVSNEDESWWVWDEEIEAVEEVQTEDQTSQMNRNNSGKLQWSQIDFSLLEGMVKVFMFGQDKYGKHNWKTGAPVTEIYESLQRHINSFMQGEDNDIESGLSHLAHAQANLMFLVHVMKNRKQFDDRYKEEFKCNYRDAKDKCESLCSYCEKINKSKYE